MVPQGRAALRWATGHLGWAHSLVPRPSPGLLCLPPTRASHLRSSLASSTPRATSAAAAQEVYSGTRCLSVEGPLQMVTHYHERQTPLLPPSLLPSSVVMLIQGWPQRDLLTVLCPAQKLNASFLSSFCPPFLLQKRRNGRRQWQLTDTRIRQIWVQIPTPSQRE